MIEIQQISKSFGKLKVLQDINIDLPKGACIALIGPNGCGKTTLIKILLGMVFPTNGLIHINGKSINKDDMYRAQIGYMPQIGRYPEQMKIEQIFEMITKLRTSGNNIDEELFTAYKLNEIGEKKMRTLSGGTTQKVSASLAFLFNPNILILDEPTAGLDPLASEILKDKILKEKNNGKLILITSHLLSELDDIVTHVIYMQEGKIRLYKSIENLKTDTQSQSFSKAIANLLKADSHD
ncbi:MAG: ABC transporter ATP-binding protein [Bacteroidia bacterium]|jgi:Cu-processing system ATP-binding protein|nr:ABC transporter ATP-binding protein [Bacteroidia bacterium]